ncbi:uncharacterized protein LOC109816125 [Cajanus cajan]|uniref:Uncharacterized protein n=1 Tax=Cajanus cajan TaxID=3821 RepID=A0A151RSU5_CAJCA|nr:uncharacterized protein LOC109816125 [Cajanus cajan]KYP45616.1 hypothetical protein KK1_032844 [Cajanus cajan]
MEGQASTLFKADEQCSSSATSSIGKDSPDNESDNDVNSSYTCHPPFHNINSLHLLLPIRRGISKYYDGKSKSFTSVADAGSVKDIAKPENAYTRRRRNLMAFNHIRNMPLRSNSGGISKRTISSSTCPSAAALAFAINYDSSSSFASEDSSSRSNSRSTPPPSSFSARRFSSLADLQNCATAATIKNASGSGK